MKNLTILLLVLALICPVGWIFAEEKQSLESLEKDRRIIVLEIIARQNGIQAAQETIRRLTQEVAVWKEQLTKIDAVIKEMKIKEKTKTEPPKK